MKQHLLYIFLATILLMLPKLSTAQAPTLGTVADFVLFSSSGAVTNTGTTRLTGNIGTNLGASTGFGNIDGVIHDQDAASLQATVDLTSAYNQLNAAVPTLFPGAALGNGQTLNVGVYSIATAATINLDLNLDAQGDPNAVFIFQINGSLSTGVGAKIHLLNGAQACNVFWKVEGLVSIAAGTTMRGTIIANNADITMAIGDTLEGRALSTNGVISVDDLRAWTPLGCGTPALMGPASPVLGTTECFALLSATDPVTNSGTTNITGDVGTNTGTTTGYNPLLVIGTIHGVPDGVTAQAATDFTVAYNYLNTLPYDIELLFPAQFGNGLILTPHVYQLNGATTLTDTLYLDAQGNPNAVFVIQVNGSFGALTSSNVVLQNGALAENVYWKIDGITNISNNSVFNGSIISQDDINLFPGAVINGRALTGAGAINTTAVTVNTPTNCAPYTVTEPTDQTVCSGNSASFSVTATGVGLTYQWRRGNVNLVDGGNISGATTSVLTINPASALDAANDYNVIISGSFVPDDTTNYVSLTILSSPAITTQPVDMTVCSGDSAAFTVVATGSNLTYQWRLGAVPIANGGAVSGVDNDTLIINPATALNSGTDYNVVVTGSCAPSVTSGTVQLIINTAPVISTQPTNDTVCAGNPASFSVVSSGLGLTYQWKKGAADIVNGGAYSGATSANLTINPATTADIATDYYVVVSNGCQPNDTSVMVSLQVDTLTTITAQPTDQTACVGDSVAFTVVPAGSGVTYQWRIGLVNLVDGGSYSGTNNDTLIIDPVSAVHASTNYNVVVTGVCVPPIVSNKVELIVNTPPVISTQPTDQTVCEGSPVTFSTAASGSGLTYQWRKGAANVTNGGAISGATTSTLTINPVAFADAATDYYVIVSGACAPNDTSNLVFLEVDTVTAITTQPIDITACSGDSIAFVVVAEGSGLTYQWQLGGLPLIDGGSVSGSTNDTLFINPATALNAGTDYNVVVTGSCAPSVTSNDVELTINELPVVTTQPTDQTVCEGSSVTFSTVATGTGLTYQWQVGGVDITDGGSVSGAATSSLTINPVAFADEATDYSVIGSGACAPNDTSNLVFLEVDTVTAITTQPIDITACSGDSIAFVVVAEGSGLTYQWQLGGLPLIDGGSVSGANNDTLIINPATALNAGTDYNVVVTGSCAPSVTSADVELAINTPVVITTQQTDQTVCDGSSVTFTVGATGSGLTYQWREGSSDVTDGGSISGATTSTLMINPATFSDAATDYYVVVSNACQPNDTSVMVSLQVDSITTITTIPVDITACEGDSVAFIVAATGSNLTYQWQLGATPITDGGEVSGSNNDTLIINPATAFTTQPTDQTVCEGNSVTFSTVASGSNLTYQWRKGSTNITNCGAISGATTANLTINPTAFSDIATDYNVVISGSCPSNDTSVMASLQVDTLSVIVTQPIDVVACSGDSVTFEVVAAGSNLPYQWRRVLIILVDGGNISGATTPTLMINPVAASDAATDYNVIITGGCVSPLTSINVELDASDCFNDLSVVKTASTMEPTVGTNMTFMIVASNIGGNATNVTVTDILQSGYTYESYTATTGTFDPSTGVWTIGTMADSSSETLTIEVLVNENGDYFNTAVIAGNGDSSPGNNTSTVEPIPVHLNIPEGFSPNGDDVNDVFVIRGIENFPTNEIQIFNRWGTLVFEASPYQDNWDGTSNSGANVGGDVLPVGTYFYVIELGDGNEAKKGTVYLNK